MARFYGVFLPWARAVSEAKRKKVDGFYQTLFFILRWDS
jgi:hypothetical protein